MHVDLNVIKSLNAYDYRVNEFLSHHSSFSGTLLEFLNLDNINDHNKVWITVRLLPENLVNKLDDFAHLHYDAMVKPNAAKFRVNGCNDDAKKSVESLKTIVKELK